MPRPMVSRRALAAIVAPSLVCLVLASLLFSCGSDKSIEQGPQGASKDPLTATLVTLADIKRWPGTSPESALLRWWQSVQYHDGPIGFAFLSPRARAGYSEQTYAAALDEARFGFDAHPAIDGRAESRADAVALTVNIEYYRKGRKIGVTPRIFRLQRIGGEWRVDDLNYFREVIREARKAQAGSARGQ